MTTKTTEPDLIEEVEELLANASAWTDERPDENGAYWHRQQGTLPELLFVQDGLVFDFSDNEPTSIGFYEGRGEFRGPIFASDTEDVADLLRRLAEDNKRLRVERDRAREKTSAF